MSVDVEYAIKKDIRNNPVVREIDVAQKREFLRTGALAALIVFTVIFSVWQHAQIVQHGYRVAKLEQDRKKEEGWNRQLRMEVETWRAPQRIESRALNELHMVQPSARETLMIELAPASSPSRAIVAQVR